VNDENRRSHEFQDEPRGKPKWVGVQVSERLSSTNLGKTSRGKPRPKPESGDPTFGDCGGARGNVIWSLRRKARALALSRPLGTGSLPPWQSKRQWRQRSGRSFRWKGSRWRFGERAGHNVSER